jgi:hypothetical protein
MLFAADQYVMLGLHVFTEMKLSFTVKQKVCGFYFSIMHHVIIFIRRLCSRFCESNLSHMDADATVLLPVSDNAHVGRLVNGSPFLT